MNIYDLQYTDVIYHFDRVIILSKYDVDELQALLPVKELLNHTSDSQIIYEWNAPGGYKSKIDASGCNVEFMRTLQWLRCGDLTYVEIAKDIIFASKNETEIYQRWFFNNVERKYNNKRFIYKGALNSTLYLGKEYGDKTKFYMRAYSDNSKISGQYCYHSEFRIMSADVIKKRLINNRGVVNVTDAMDIYMALEKRFLKYNQ